ncbi:MAG: exodeoxyribonuclease VII small subunit [Porphyromonadaceae bacterium CG2_30_38_12]|nr:MAG: exodeoxyribonuclease VII small subunit [Porphyromonadaceae bacterium CG2_30_38_12]
MTKQKLTYNEAVRELESILSELENNKMLTMDDIAAQVKRAAILMEFCKKQLHEMDKELEKIMDEVDKI